MRKLLPLLALLPLLLSPMACKGTEKSEPAASKPQQTGPASGC